MDRLIRLRLAALLDTKRTICGHAQGHSQGEAGEEGRVLIELAVALMLQPIAREAMETRALRVSIVEAESRPARSVSIDDLVVIEDGVAREVVDVCADTRPLTLVLIVDSSVAMAPFYRLHALDPLLAFLRRLPAGARFAVWTTGDRPTKILDFGDDTGLAASALQRVVPAGGNTLYDTIDEALADLVRREGERLAVVIVSASGAETSSREEPRALESAGARGAVEFSAVLVLEDGRTDALDVATEPPAPIEQRSRYERALVGLVEKSDGLFESILSGMGIDRDLKRIAADLAGRHTLLYRAPAGTRAKKTLIKMAHPAYTARIRSDSRSHE